MANLTVTQDLYDQLAQEQQNYHMMGMEYLNGSDLPEVGSSLPEYLARLHFNGNTQQANDLAIQAGIPQADYTRYIQGINDSTAKSSPALINAISGIGNTVAENPALLFAAPLAIAGIGGAIAGAGAGGGGSALDTMLGNIGSIASGTAPAAAYTGGLGALASAALPAAGYSGLASIPGVADMTVLGSASGGGGALGSILGNIGSIATGQVLGGTMTGPNPQGPISSTGTPLALTNSSGGALGNILGNIQDIASGNPLGGTMTGPNPVGPVTNTGSPLLTSATGGDLSPINVNQNYLPSNTPSIPPGDPTQVGPLLGDGSVLLPGGGTTSIPAPGVGLNNNTPPINQGNQGPPVPNVTNPTSGLPDWLGPLTDIFGSLLGAHEQAGASQDAANAIRDTSANQLNFLRETRDQQIALQQPFLDASKAALPRLAQLAGLDPNGPSTQSLMEADPGYQFRLDQGNKAVANSAAAKGGLLSGGFAKDLLKYAQGYASQEYGNIYNRVANIAGFGQVAANTAGSAIGQYGNNGAQVIGNAGNASAYNNLQRGNIWANAINDIGSTDWSKFFGNGG